MDTTYDVFVSHNGLDKPVVERLCWALLEAGVRPWFDKWDLAPGDVWMTEVERLLERVPPVLVCVGEHGLSAWHDAERQAALDRSTESACGRAHHARHRADRGGIERTCSQKGSRGVRDEDARAS